MRWSVQAGKICLGGNEDITYNPNQCPEHIANTPCAPQCPAADPARPTENCRNPTATGQSHHLDTASLPSNCAPLTETASCLVCDNRAGAESNYLVFIGPNEVVCTNPIAAAAPPGGSSSTAGIIAFVLFVVGVGGVVYAVSTADSSSPRLACCVPLKTVPGTSSGG